MIYVTMCIFHSSQKHHTREDLICKPRSTNFTAHSQYECLLCLFCLWNNCRWSCMHASWKYNSILWNNMAFLCGCRDMSDSDRSFFLSLSFLSLWKTFSESRWPSRECSSVQSIRLWVLSWKITYLCSRAERNWSGHYPQILIMLVLVSFDQKGYFSRFRK